MGAYTQLIARGLFMTLMLFAATVSAQQTAQVQGGQFERLGSWEVHYSAFPSSFLQPEVAQAYNLVRSRAQAVISISVLDQESKQSQRVAMSGYALNSLGQRKELNFRRITEGDALYYLSSIQHGNDDRYRFFITIRHGDNSEELRFTQTFYRN
ncbi:DUF4426 domain-containing protein [Aliidiomarina taiwanensis]|uniref:DUF4426 domain-containing protein n=1 Tax=Aliidiomarina taiwanensis TaxID=946228 RepID=A0A432WZZ6_9GAMM|nr:DUF4426 domain-containing protein [Aliidiomarina taiwanensis]RUO39344.1 DUF4426 domain-containing protein [Aliidiomarina taiwanensis]